MNSVWEGRSNRFGCANPYIVALAAIYPCLGGVVAAGLRLQHPRSDALPMGETGRDPNAAWYHGCPPGAATGRHSEACARRRPTNPCDA